MENNFGNLITVVIDVLKKGDVLKNRYTVKEIISQGELANVYLVEDSQLLKEWVLKEYILPMKNPRQIDRSVQRFERDIMILAGLKNSGIPEFVDHFSIVDRQYLVMEFVQGRTLEKILEETFQPMYEPDVLKLGIQLAGIIAFLHKQSPPIILGDLKPSHIVITPDNHVKLIDFGICKHFSIIGDIQSRKPGTPGYAPPEQFGQNILDERSDIYALGAILHQLLTLRNPAKLPNMFKFPPISQTNPRVSSIFEGIIDKATRYNPSERYYNALDMKREMEELLSKRGKTSNPPLERTVSKANTQKNLDSSTIFSSPELKAMEMSPHRETKESRRMPNKNILVITVIFLFVVLSGLTGYYFISKNREKDSQVKNTLESPFAEVKDHRILEIREEGLSHYIKGIETKDKNELALAISNLRKVITAHPTDAVSQIYLENAQILMQGRPYLKIAALLSLTGENFEAGMQILSGLSVAQSQHNNHSKDKKLFIEIFDNKSQLDETIKLASTLSGRDDLFAVIGPIRSPFLSSTAPFFNESEITQISPTGSSPELENLGEFTFRTAGDGRDLAFHMAETAVNDLKLNKLAVVFDPTQSYSKFLGEIFYKDVQEKGAKAKVFHTPLDAEDFTPILKDIKNYKPDGIFFVAYHNQQGRFAKQMTKLGMKAAHLSTTSVYSDQLISEGGKSVEGIILNSYFYPDEEDKRAAEFLKLFYEKYPNVHPNFRAAVAYDSLRAVSAAINNGVETPKALAHFLKHELGKSIFLEGVTGSIEFDEFGRRNKLNLMILTVHKGKFVKYRQ